MGLHARAEPGQQGQRAQGAGRPRGQLPLRPRQDPRRVHGALPEPGEPARRRRPAGARPHPEAAHPAAHTPGDRGGSEGLRGSRGGALRPVPEHRDHDLQQGRHQSGTERHPVRIHAAEGCGGGAARPALARRRRRWPPRTASTSRARSTCRRSPTPSIRPGVRSRHATT